MSKISKSNNLIKLNADIKERNRSSAIGKQIRKKIPRSSYELRLLP